jgi:magnesium-protoporphyrin IX monomethyl ester (oxidative) cyclase
LTLIESNNNDNQSSVKRAERAVTSAVIHIPTSHPRPSCATRPESDQRRSAMTQANTQATDTTGEAQRNTLLSPRFYRTDYAALDRLDISPVREEWDAMMAEFERDKNREHFRQDVDFDGETHPMSDELRTEFLDFLTSSITAEFSGCVLYKEIEKNVSNPDIATLMNRMARDESRHAGFINRSLKHLGVAVDLGFLKREKKYTFFRPKFIYYATYLSEKIGYARYITIYRHLEKHPEQRFHPIFKWFMEWCDDEFRHGEAFALIMRAHPQLVRGINVAWIRFFLLAVYATMYVRDHSRPALYEALGIDPTEFDYQVFDITTTISKQIFPLTLDTDNPKFRRGLQRMCDCNLAIEAAKQRGGVVGRLQQARHSTVAALTFARLYLMPTKRNQAPETVRMAPAW